MYKVVHGKVVKVGRNKGIKRGLPMSPYSTDTTAEPTVDMSLKGKKNGLCNVSACLAPGATWYNKSTMRYYCRDCAREINWPGGRKDCMELYGTPFLCEEEL